MANRNKGYRNKAIDFVITFRDLVCGFCEYAENNIIFPCPECGQQVKCNITVMKDNFDLIGLFKCKCNHSLRKSVKSDELRRQFAKIVGRDIRQYDSSSATIAELEYHRRRMYTKQEFYA
ncbi:MAG: hypothetical protein JXA38_00670 [Methanosarcinaceae archaeon]|nr:hypothetical protein [Methanosarcinaceae archaeon]